MPIIRLVPLGRLPRAVQRLDHLLGQGTLFQILQVRLELRLAADADDDAVVALAFALAVVDAADAQRRVVRHPAQGDFHLRQAGGGGGFVYDLEGIKDAVAEVALAVGLACFCFVAVFFGTGGRG